MNIVLIGFMASGKTSVGRRAAKRLGFRFMDTDHFIETEQGCAISEIFEKLGEPAFRAMETAVAQRLKTLDNCVLATGGGIVTTPGNLDLLKDAGVVVFLKADPEDIIRRLQNDVRRPKVQGGDLRTRVMTLLAERMPLYEQADIVIETAGKTPNQVAGEVLRLATGFRRNTGTVTLTDGPPPREAHS